MLVDINCMRNKVKNYSLLRIGFYFLFEKYTISACFPSGCFHYRDKANAPIKSVSKFPRRNVACNRDISDNCHPVSVFGKAAENAGKFENVTGITVLKGDRYFSEKVLCRFCVPVQARYV